MKKKHIPAPLWTEILKKMVEYNLMTAQVTIPMDLSKSTFYNEKREFFNGGVMPRKPGSGSERTYETKDYEQFLRDVVNSLPPIFGSERVWMEAKRLGAPFGQSVCYRMLKELGLLQPREKGRYRKRYEPLLVDGPNQIYLIDTTIWVVGPIIDETTAMGWDLLGGIANGTEMEKRILSKTDVPELPSTYVKESKADPIYAVSVKGKIFKEIRSFVVYTNAEKAMRERESRNRDLRIIGKALSHLSMTGDTWTEAKLHKNIYTIVGPWRSYLDVRVKRGEVKPRIDWTFRERRLQIASETDGKYLLLCTDETMDASDAVGTYFSKDFAEKLFRTLKTDVGIEPARHRLAPRVRAYIFVCMLAYRLFMALRWLLIEKGVTKKTGEFMDRLLDELWEVERMEIVLGGQKRTWFLNMTEFIEEGLRKVGMKPILKEGSGTV